MFNDRDLDVIKDLLLSKEDKTDYENILLEKVSTLIEMSEFKKDIDTKRDAFNERLTKIVEKSNNVK